MVFSTRDEILIEEFFSSGHGQAKYGQLACVSECETPKLQYREAATVRQGHQSPNLGEIVTASVYNWRAGIWFASIGFKGHPARQAECAPPIATANDDLAPTDLRHCRKELVGAKWTI